MVTQIAIIIVVITIIIKNYNNNNSTTSDNNNNNNVHTYVKNIILFVISSVAISNSNHKQKH